MSTLLASSISGGLGSGPNENANMINRVRNSTDSMNMHQLKPLQMLKEANAQQMMRGQNTGSRRDPRRPAINNLMSSMSGMNN